MMKIIDRLLTTAGFVTLSACGGTAPMAATPEPIAPVASSPSPPPAASPSEEPAPPAPTEAAPAEEGPSPSDKRDNFKAAPKEPPAGEAVPKEKKKGSLGGNTFGFPGVRPVLAQPAAQQLRLHFLDVGQGDSTLIECPGGERILVDGGSGIAASASPEGARDHLRGVLGNSMSIDMVVVSHPDRDHYNALPYLLEGVQVGHVQVVGAAGEYSGSFVTWLAAIPSSRKTRITAESHDPLDTPNATMDCGPATVHVLSVSARGTPDNSPKNSLSMTLMVSYRDFDAILTADATFVTEKKILGRYPSWWLDAELLKIGHHGSSTTSTSPDWVTATAPDIAVVSSGFDNSHGHPRQTVVAAVATKTGTAAAHAFRWYRSQTQPEEVADYKEAIYGTGTSGTIVVGSNGSDYWVEQER